MVSRRITLRQSDLRTAEPTRGPVEYRIAPTGGAPTPGPDAAICAKIRPIPVRSRGSVKFSHWMPYFDTPQKCGQISVVASIPDSFGEAMLYV